MPVLKQGSSGSDVTTLQQRLKELGFDPNGVDGDFGPGTLAAVIAFQNSKGLKADGKVGPDTLTALNLNGDAVSAAPVAGATSIGGSVPPFSTGLNEDDYKQAAELLNCEIAAIKAVAQVESAGGGFLPDGRPKILFERHKFHQFTGGAFAAKHPDLSNPSQGGYGNGGAHQWDRFNEAFALNPTAAIKSCSWGKFQAMGFNFARCGFATLEDFHTAMLKSEGEHLRAFCNFITNCKLDGALRNRKWATFALGYNGKTYRKNKYDTRLADAYRKFSQQ